MVNIDNGFGAGYLACSILADCSCEPLRNGDANHRR